jgi:hypothetical protein
MLVPMKSHLLYLATVRSAKLSVSREHFFDSYDTDLS